jgi:hypothetical protein
LTEYHPSPGFPEAVYSPKHRHRSMFSFDRPKGRSARTPPPTLLFSLHLSKNTRLTQRRKRPPRPPAGPTEPPRSRSPQATRSLPNPAADEVVLPEPLPQVNTYFEEFSRNRRPQPTSSVFRQASAFAEAYSPLREHHSDRSNPSECFSLSSEEPWGHAIYWHPWLVPLIGIK